MATTVDAEVLAGYITLGNLEGLRKFAPPSFDWSQPLGSAKLPALVHVIIKGLSARDAGRAANYVKIAEWLLKAGADPTYKITRNARQCSVYKENQKDTTELMVPYEGHCAVSFAFAWLGQMQLCKGGADWPTSRKFLEDIVELFALTKVGGNSHSADVTVPQSTVDLWESVRDSTSSHNVILEAGGWGGVGTRPDPDSCLASLESDARVCNDGGHQQAHSSQGFLICGRLALPGCLVHELYSSGA